MSNLSNPNITNIYTIEISLGQTAVLNSRQRYDVLRFFSDIGGVFEIFLVLAGIFVFPYSEYSFILKAGKKLFQAKTKNRDLFPHSNQYDELIMSDPESADPGNETKTYRTFRLTKRQRCCFYMYLNCRYLFKCCTCCACVRKYNQFFRLYGKTQSKFDNDVDIVSLVRSLFELRYLINDHLKISKYHLKEGIQKQNTINIDNDRSHSLEKENETISNELDEFDNLQSFPQ